MTKRNYEFSGAGDAKYLVSWLNSGQSAGRQRVAEMLSLYEELGKHPPQAWHPGQPKTGRGAMWLRLQELLDRYEYKFRAWPQYTVLESAKKLTGEAVSESSAVLVLHRLKEMYSLSKVKRCAGCTRWIFAPKISDKFHEEACRIKTYQSNPAWCERNNAERRKRYKIRKNNPKIRYQERRGSL
jgi:hypothetical protein